MSRMVNMFLVRINDQFHFSGHNCYFKSFFRLLPDRSTQVSIIQDTLENPPYNLPTAVFSLDDLYLTHADQVHLAHQHPNNPLVQHRGQPSTHDISLAKSIFSSLSRGSPTGIPQYNKAAFDGQGDRVPADDWQKVNLDGQNVIKVVLFEGWSVGFRPLSEEALNQKWEEAMVARKAGNYLGRLGHNTLENVASINRALSEYDQITE
jgi:D-glycerate 3-kinase